MSYMSCQQQFVQSHYFSISMIYIVGKATRFDEVKCLFIDLLLIFILLFFTIQSCESYNWTELIKNDSVKFLFIDFLLTPFTGAILFGLYSKSKKYG